VAWLLVGVALLYLVGMNLFLRTRLFRDAIGADPGSLLVDYTTAYSVWPGSIHAEGVSIRGRDSHVEWILRLDRCDFDVSFSDLAHKKFRADHVRGDGVSMRVRRRVDRVTPETMSALPPVPGFERPPLTDVGPPAPPLTDATYNLWSIELDDVVATRVREVWVDTVRYSGDVELRGRWVFRPLRWLDVGPATIDVRSLDVAFGTVEPWASGVAGALGVTVHPFNLETVPSADIVHQVSVRGDVSGKAQVANVTNRALEGAGVDVTRAEAPFQLRVDVDHGVLRAGTHLRTEPFDARAAAAGLVFEASLQADVQVDGDGVGYADLRVSDFDAIAGGQPRARAAKAALTLSSRELDLARTPFSAPRYAVEVDGATTDSLAYWCSRFPVLPGVSVASGPLTAGGRLEGEVRQETGKGYVRFGVRALRLARGHDSLDLDLTGTVRLDASLEKKRFVLSGSEVSLRDVRAAVRGVTVDARSVFAGAESLVVDRTGVAGRVSVDAPVVEVPSLVAVGALLPLPADIAIESGRGTAGVHLLIDISKRVATGHVAFAARDLRLRIGAQRMEGDLSVSMSAKESGAATDLSGSQVDFKPVGTTNVGSTRDWWGRVRLRQATLALLPDVRLRTYLTAAARDGSPLTALVTDNTALPQWLLDVVSTKGLEATGELVVTPSVFALRSVVAHAEGVDIGFEFGKIGEARKEWALLLDLGVALAGVDVANGGTQVLLFGARPWFQAKVASLERVERRSE
jgi:hypothetical protein